MPDIVSPFDEHAFRARVIPTLVVVVIPVMGFLCWLPAFSTTQLTLVAVLSLVLTSLFSQIGRDLGKALEPKLFEEWGGRPSVQLLRCSTKLLSKETRERYRLKLESIDRNLRIPTEFEELVDPQAADSRYDSASLFLRETTRSKSAFPVVFNENVNYGFRRNLLAMKPAGILLCVAGAISSITATIVGMKGSAVDSEASSLVIAFLNAALLTWWCLRINSQWVRVAAFAYAERLLGSCDSLPGAASSPKSGASETSKE